MWVKSVSKSDGSRETYYRFSYVCNMVEVVERYGVASYKEASSLKLCDHDTASYPGLSQLILQQASMFHNKDDLWSDQHLVDIAPDIRLVPAEMFPTHQRYSLVDSSSSNNYSRR